MKNEQIFTEQIENLIAQGEENRNVFVEMFDDQIQKIKDRLNSLDETRDMAEKQYQTEELPLGLYNIIVKKLDNTEKELEDLLKEVVDKRNEVVIEYNNLIAKANSLKVVMM